MSLATRVVLAAVSGLLALHATGISAADSAGGTSMRGDWLKGDLHIHSHHSRDSSNNSIGKIVRFAEDQGFDFLAITDHDNHVDGDVAAHTWAAPEWRSDKVVLLYAAEWTTDRGHGNVFSSRPFDEVQFHRIRDARDADILALKRRMKVHLSANHPTNKDHFGFSYDLVDSIEVWNSSNWAKNIPSLAVWDDMLKSGRKLPARGGSDAHHGWPDTSADRSSNSIERLANYIGTPTTWVYARTRDRQGVVDALTVGHSSISANPNAPRVEFSVDHDGDGSPDAMMGDSLRATGKAVIFHVKLAQCDIPWAAYQVKVVRNGETFGTYAVDAEKPEVTFTDTPPERGRSYYRVEVQGPQSAYPAVPMSAGITGTMVALSNPIFFNFDPNF
ncbi:Predicted metal-dependent phosphoesterase TrpH, contains PHP domain [Novosphingobium sp. CF614]|uniref:CehA/McbA family metallohydrolase n=1 Tax=Novosphingobium sp. CF614 TaxID=1884364 RepID=UPI0008EE726B|nr:CehA/McbA family metallohydrolase [Novosphingobium sp. CF614]SFG08165.1 Predicted metal-dependent phosphoesterase TrpH, contains PHP domain [Novosphingobium sp. CF614]